MSSAEQFAITFPGDGRSPGLDDALRNAGYRIIMLPEWPPDHVWSDRELADLFADADVVHATSSLSYPAQVLQAATRLRMVISNGIRVDHIDVDAATRLGVLVANCPTENSVMSVAEATITLILALLSRMNSKQAALRAGTWRPVPPTDHLWRKTVGLVGYGRIAHVGEARLAGWGVTVHASDPYVPGTVPLDQLLAASDVVSLHVVKTPETTGLIGQRELHLMKRTAIIVNTSRGGVIDEDALAAAVDAGAIAGAAIDVLGTSPYVWDNPLLRCDPSRVILTPHAISHGGDNSEKAEMALENIQRATRGDLPERINREVIPAWKERFAHQQG